MGFIAVSPRRSDLSFKMTRRKKVAPKQPIPTQSAPKQSALKRSAPKPAAPKPAAPREAAFKQSAPKSSAPKPAAPKQAAQLTLSMNTPKSMARVFDPFDYVTEEELLNIDAQFAVSMKGVDVVLFWTGVEWAHVQRWAKIWKLTTLTIAMGPLMDTANPSSPKAQKGKKAYSRYVKGASGRFAHYARQHCRVVVLTNPPPNIYSNRDNNTYQQLEEPILKGLFGDTPVRRIDYLHPNVSGAAHVTYQTWPCDKSQEWTIPFSGGRIYSWKGLNWSYQSLVTMSQVCLITQQKQISSVASELHVELAQSSDQRDHGALNHMTVAKDLPEETMDGTVVEDIVTEVRCVDSLQQEVDLIEEIRPSPDWGIRGHASNVQSAGSTSGELAKSDSHLTDTQIHDRVHKRTGLHGEELLKHSSSPTPAYTIKRCRMPKNTTAPVINVDAIAIGTQVTVCVDEQDVNKDFLYLTMKCAFGLQNWWRLRWIDDDDKE